MSAEFDKSIEELFERSNNLRSADVLFRLFKQNSAPETYKVRSLGADCQALLASGVNDDYEGSLSLQDMVSGGLALILYGGTLEELTDTGSYFTPQILLEIKTHTRVARVTGTDGIEINFPKSLVVPSKATDWALKLARQCSTLASEYLISVYREE